MSCPTPAILLMVTKFPRMDPEHDILMDPFCETHLQTLIIKSSIIKKIFTIFNASDNLRESVICHNLRDFGDLLNNLNP